MTFWLTVIVLDYCEAPSDEQGRKSRGRTPGRSLTLQVVSRRGNSAVVCRPWSIPRQPSSASAPTPTTVCPITTDSESIPELPSPSSGIRLPGAPQQDYTGLLLSGRGAAGNNRKQAVPGAVGRLCDLLTVRQVIASGVRQQIADDAPVARHGETEARQFRTGAAARIANPVYP